MKKVLTSVLILAILVGGVWFGVEYHQTQKELEEVKGELITVTQESLSFQKALEKTKNENQELNSTIESLEDENTQLLETKETLESEKEILTNTNKDLKKEITNLKAELKK